ncbi:dihydrofolate reductase family protein [uncultured Corynebacterium sp.]|uniref:dihydrofolate reductase family protein n=1 Tax=uncultured Corynebacterium sp. TaxID=159447 RepID=UPI0025F568AA|nr:dihydrofolate reductase family protein [uncultured Corynebacterium sp.]
MIWLGDLDDPSSDAAGFIRPLDGVTAIAITSVDGRGALDGTSGGLGNPADAAVLRAVRDTADVVIVGAGTARAENYGPAAPPTRLAVLSRSLDLDPSSRLFSGNSGADSPPAPIIVTTATSTGDRPFDDRHDERRRALVEAGADVVVLADSSPRALIAALRDRGLRRIVVEGGPSVYRQFLDDDAVDRIHLTLSPMVVGGGPATFGTGESERPSEGAAGPPRGFRVEAVAHSDSHLFVRYFRERTG